VRPPGHSDASTSRRRAPTCLSRSTVLLLRRCERASRGIYYTACSAQSGWGGTNPALHVVNTATGEDRVLGTLEKFSITTVFGLAVSPDGRVIVYDRLLREGHDLMLIENFR
jgi:hypothetical protein